MDSDQDRPRTVDLLIQARWIAPVSEQENQPELLENHSLVIQQGRILDLLPSQLASQRYQAQQTIELKEHLLTPGLVNCHSHAAMSLLRGYADDLPLMTWLEQHIWPAEQRWVSGEMVYDGTQLALAEAIKSGTSCLSDMYFFPDQAAKACHEAGIRSQLFAPVLDFPTQWAQSAQEYISKANQLFDDYSSHDLVSIGYGPHAPYTVSDEPLQKIQTMAAETQALVQIHLHETQFEVEEAVKQTGMRPIERLAKLGFLSPQVQCVHMTQIEASDIELLNSTGAQVIHCPESNLKLASGFCPSAWLLKEGINVALGTDGAASNNNLDMLEEAHCAALIGKAVAQDASALPAHQVLKMATLNGAKALGLSEQIGSLEIGKQADIAAFEFKGIEHSPIYNPISHLIYSAASNTVSHLWVAGRILLKDRQLTCLSESELLEKANHWRGKIAAS